MLFKAALVAISTLAPGAVVVVGIAWWGVTFTGTIRESYYPSDHSKVGTATGRGSDLRYEGAEADRLRGRGFSQSRRWHKSPRST